MVAQNGDHEIRMIIVVELFLQGTILWRSLIQLALERGRGVVGTEDLCAEILRVGLQILHQAMVT
jgi:hypothetical protein